MPISLVEDGLKLFKHRLCKQLKHSGIKESNILLSETPNFLFL